MEILRQGCEGDDVLHWQQFLLGLRLLERGVDGIFGPFTDRATRAYQRRRRLVANGVVGPETYAAALKDGFDPGFVDPRGGTSGLDWPPKPLFAPLVSNAERHDVFGRFEFERVSSTSDNIRIVDDWADRNLTTVTIPQLARVRGAPASGRIRVHRLVAEQMRALFALWEEKDLLRLVLTFGGAYAPRYVRGSASTLSNHAWGAAFDVNEDYNRLGHVPPLRGQRGAVRELVPDANEFGFYWGGHYRGRADGMHFECARPLG